MKVHDPPVPWPTFDHIVLCWVLTVQGQGQNLSSYAAGITGHVEECRVSYKIKSQKKIGGWEESQGSHGLYETLEWGGSNL